MPGIRRRRAPWADSRRSTFLAVIPPASSPWGQSAPLAAFDAFDAFDAVTPCRPQVTVDPSLKTMTLSGSLPVEKRSRLAEARDTEDSRSTRLTMRFISP